MTPALAYIAAPFSDPSETIRRWHVARARLLARLAMACNLAPVVVHGEIEAGTYGDDSDPEQRARGMAASAAICRGVLATPGAVLWALLRDDGGMSAGTAAEWEIAEDVRHGRVRSTWDVWRDFVNTEHPDLLPEWDRLATRPDAVGEPAIGPWEHVASVVSYRYYGGQNCVDNTAATVSHIGWSIWVQGWAGKQIASGPETGAQGRAAADAALRRVGVMG